ncbi:hypothetical protein SEA_YUUY_62 [Microbacterium phage YuuY]|nr:hypothetical protein SEA_YUUY_62 [Microbacterium phage YuuY]
MIMDNRITLTINGRTVHWDVDPQTAAVLAQNLISVLGPAKEGA